MADRLQLPLRTWSVRKVADPADTEVAIGAVAAGPVAASVKVGRGMTGGGMAAAGVVVWRYGVEASGQAAAARQLGWLQEQERELARRQRLFGDPEPGAFRGRHLIVVDDGIATGMTVQAALRSLRQLQPASLTLAVPVVDRAVAIDLKRQLDRLKPWRWWTTCWRWVCGSSGSSSSRTRRCWSCCNRSSGSLAWRVSVDQAG